MTDAQATERFAWLEMNFDLTALIPDFSEYHWGVKLLAIVWLLATFGLVFTHFFVPKIEPVDKWLPASSESCDGPGRLDSFRGE